MDPIKFCSILSVMFGATSFLVVLVASQSPSTPQGSVSGPPPASTSTFLPLSPSPSSSSTSSFQSSSPSTLPSAAPSLRESPLSTPSPSASLFPSSSPKHSLPSLTTTSALSTTEQPTTPYPSTGPLTTKKFKARMTVNETYIPGYSNSSSAEFKTFATNFSQTVGDFLGKKLIGFEHVQVTKLENGSVVVNFDIVVQQSSNASEIVIVEALATGSGTELGYTILGEVSVNATDQLSTSSTPSPTYTVTVSVFTFLTSSRSSSSSPAGSVSGSPPASTSAFPPLSPSPSSSSTSSFQSSSPSTLPSAAPSLRESPLSTPSPSASLFPSSSPKHSLPSLTTTSVLSTTEQSTTPYPSTGPPTTKKFKARMTVNETYIPGYSNSSSAEFKTFATNFSQTVGDFLGKKLIGFEHVRVTKLENGSVVVNFDIVVQQSSNASVIVIVEALETGNGTELGYTILGEVSVNATDQLSTSSSPPPTYTVTGSPSVSASAPPPSSSSAGSVSRPPLPSTSPSPSPSPPPPSPPPSSSSAGSVSGSSLPSTSASTSPSPPPPSPPPSSSSAGSVSGPSLLSTSPAGSVSESPLPSTSASPSTSPPPPSPPPSSSSVGSTTSTTEKHESGLEKWIIVLIATGSVIIILGIALTIIVHQNRRLRSMHEGNFPVFRIEDDHSRSLQPRMYSVSSNTKEMYQISVPGEKAGSTNSHELTTFSPDSEGVTGTSNTAYHKMEGDKSELDNQSLDDNKNDASDEEGEKEDVSFQPGLGFI